MAIRVETVSVPDNLPDGLPDSKPHDPFADLNARQRDAATSGLDCDEALLVIAGAGTGKTTTLANRVAAQVLAGALPERILLLTFTRRAASEMVRRARRLVERAAPERARALPWAGTFHSIANRLLRRFAHSLCLDPAFTVLDRSDSTDLLNFVRGDLGLAGKSKRFPRKATCLSIYSRTVNAREPLEETLSRYYPWAAEWEADLRSLFRGYIEAKQKRNLLDYDDLLLYWAALMSEPKLAIHARELFDWVLVDEYQDTNAIQAEILFGLCPDGKRLTVVGDDAQAIYSFRAAEVKNIIEFPAQCQPPARVVTLEQNYRSTQPILDAANSVIGLAGEGFRKELVAATRRSGGKPRLVTVEDEAEQVEYITREVLAAREGGAMLKDQAVLFRAAHHSDMLEVELGRKNIPFVKFGGLKFLEAAHVKDVLCVLRLAENPLDSVAAYRVLQLLPGIGPAAAKRGAEAMLSPSPIESLRGLKVASEAGEALAGLCNLLGNLRNPDSEWTRQFAQVRTWYAPILEDNYASAAVRESDLEALESISAQYPSRERLISELTLDRPEAAGDHAGPPHLDEDFLILSTIHSAKGQEWDSVYVMNLVDGAIPSDMALRDKLGVEEERRLLYVAMTRARKSLSMVQPLRFMIHKQHKHGDKHVYAPRSRFVPDSILDRFEAVGVARDTLGETSVSKGAGQIDVGAKLRDMW